MMDRLEKGRAKRGQVVPEEVQCYERMDSEDLILLLHSSEPKKRTIAAMLIGRRKIINAILPLCEAIRIEKALYPRIAISEALGSMGEAAVKPLTSLLGKIGNNQESALPVKYFNKKSFPLPRDMAARTLIKIGRPAITQLIRVIGEGDGFEVQQALDAIGSIVNKTNDPRPLDTLLKALNDYSMNPLTTWKIVRALSGFKFREAVDPLVFLLKNHKEAAIRWEAARSLGHIEKLNADEIAVLEKALNDENDQVRLAAKISLKQLLLRK
ncbi:MAG: HEAT repeat domain-containing protein [Clostridia bacterium]|nr:HEAT repeat domain-containing protein [Clostridia bacterium]